MQRLAPFLFTHIIGAILAEQGRTPDFGLANGFCIRKNAPCRNSRGMVCNRLRGNIFFMRFIMDADVETKIKELQEQIDEINKRLKKIESKKNKKKESKAPAGLPVMHSY